MKWFSKKENNPDPIVSGVIWLLQNRSREFFSHKTRSCEETIHFVGGNCGLSVHWFYDVVDRKTLLSICSNQYGTYVPSAPERRKLDEAIKVWRDLGLAITVVNALLEAR